MALWVLRDMSTARAAPHQPPAVQTYVLEHDWGSLADAIRRELDRGGQVYYLHNRAETIDRTAAKLITWWGRMHGGCGPRQMAPRRPTSDEPDDRRGVERWCVPPSSDGIDLPNANTLYHRKRRPPAWPSPPASGPVGWSSRRALPTGPIVWPKGLGGV